MSPRREAPPAPLPASNIKSLRETVGLSQIELAERLGYSLKTIQRWESGARPRKMALEILHGLRDEDYSGNASAGFRFRFVDLFAGIGGLRRGFESIGGECVYTSEWDKFAVQTYRANFDCSHGIAGDITQVRAEEIPSHDVLLAGFPCQPFSIAGVSKKNSLGRPHGFACDTQGTLFFDVARILGFHRPAAFMLENVKNLASHDGGKTFEIIRKVLTEELGYQLHTRIIDGGAWVPQHRERMYLVGFREPNDFDLARMAVPSREKRFTLGSILHPEDGSETHEPPYTDGRGRVNDKYVLTEHLWQYLQDYAAKHKAAGNGFGFGLVGPNDVARTLSARYYKDGSEILVKRPHGPPRRLTPRECARLMGFDAPRGHEFKIPVSDTQAYRQFGNSVVVPAVRAVAHAMKPFIVRKPGARIRSSVRVATPLDIPMTDIVDRATRSRMMSGIRGKNTQPELTVRKALHRARLRFRLHAKHLPGKPDIVLPKYGSIVNVHGCFWHCHPGCRFATTPSTNRAFWSAKLRANVERDARTDQQLNALGWRVFTIWECETADETRLADIARAITEATPKNRGALTISRRRKGSGT